MKLTSSLPLHHHVISVVAHKAQGMRTAKLQTVINASPILADPDERRTPRAPFVSRGADHYTHALLNRPSTRRHGTIYSADVDRHWRLHAQIARSEPAHCLAERSSRET